jgi:hypothetical protein
LHTHIFNVFSGVCSDWTGWFEQRETRRAGDGDNRPIQAADSWVVFGPVGMENLSKILQSYGKSIFVNETDEDGSTPNRETGESSAVLDADPVTKTTRAFCFHAPAHLGQRQGADIGGDRIGYDLPGSDADILTFLERIRRFEIKAVLARIQGRGIGLKGLLGRKWKIGDDGLDGQTIIPAFVGSCCMGRVGGHGSILPEADGAARTG